MATKRKPKQQTESVPVATPTYAPVSEVKFVPVNQIASIRNTGRYDPAPSDESIDRMASAIREQGQLAPIRLRRTAPDAYEPIFGFTRLAACRKLEREVWAEIVECDALTAMADSFAENRHRADLTPMDVAYCVGQLVDAGMAASKVATQYQLTEGRISQLRRYLQLPEAVRIAMARGQLTDQGALALCRLRTDDGALDTDTILTVFGACKLSVETELVDPEGPEDGPKITREFYRGKDVVNAVEKVLALRNPQVPAENPASADAGDKPESESDPASARHETTAKVAVGVVVRTIQRVLDNGTMSLETRGTLQAIIEFFDDNIGSAELEDDIAEAFGTTVDQLFPDSRGADVKVDEPTPAKRGRKKKTESPVT